MHDNGGSMDVLMKGLADTLDNLVGLLALLVGIEWIPPQELPGPG